MILVRFRWVCELFFYFLLSFCWTVPLSYITRQYFVSCFRRTCRWERKVGRRWWWRHGSMRTDRIFRCRARTFLCSWWDGRSSWIHSRWLHNFRCDEIDIPSRRTFHHLSHTLRHSDNLPPSQSSDPSTPPVMQPDHSNLNISRWDLRSWPFCSAPRQNNHQR